ncbi:MULTISPECIES: hypothetical protein [Dietzia]|uniref:hypothetical protein n=1 Tax=Dietzia TaxID=37914 RepID=UPI0033661EDB
MENSEPRDVVVPLVWPTDGTPPTPANQHQIQIAQDADGGPGEMILSLGYIVPPNLSPEQVMELEQTGQALQVNPVGRFMISRHQAEALVASLQDMIANWDRFSAHIRGGRADE